MSEQQEPEKPESEEEKIWVVCCVCNKVLQVGNIPGDKRTSHGLCESARKKRLPKCKASEAAWIRLSEMPNFWGFAFGISIY